MTPQETYDIYMSTLSDEQLLINLALARDDLQDAATHHHETEWHEACFAGTVCYAMEANKRGLSLEDAE